MEYVFTEDYGSPEFQLQHSILSAKVEALKSGIAVDGITVGVGVSRPALDTAKPQTFRWLCEQFLRRTKVKTKSRDDTKTKAKRSLESCCQEPIKRNQPNAEKFGDFPLSGSWAMKLSHLEILRDRVAEMKGKTGGPSAANMRVKHLRGLFRWAATRGLLEHDIAAHLERVGERTGGHHTWTAEELAAYEKRHFVGTVARMAFDIFQYTGCRISDIIKVGPKHVHDDKDRRGKPIKVLRFHTTKKKAGDEVGPEVSVGMGLPLLDLIAACNQKGEATWLVTERGKPFASPTAFGNKFRDWVREAGLPTGDRQKGIKGCVPHGIRKSVASRAAENGATHQQAMAMFGWLTEKEFTDYARKASRRKMGREAITLLSK